VNDLVVDNARPELKPLRIAGEDNYRIMSQAFVAGSYSNCATISANTNHIVLYSLLPVSYLGLETSFLRLQSFSLQIFLALTL
jgi:hypothetical protein